VTTDPLAVGSEPDLVERIREEIERTGPMTFARFMELALHDPEHGYYRRADPAPGRPGDFLTAPETHPIFGWTIARQLGEMWERLDRPDPFGVREYGAGTGALAIAILERLRKDGSGLVEAVRYQPVEIERRRVDAFAQRGADAGFGAALGGGMPTPFVGAVLANEFLDALPVHRVAIAGGRLQELRVGWVDDRFVDIAGEPSTPALGGRLAAERIALGEGQRAEVCLAIDPWMAEVAATLRRGYVLGVDYGRAAAELYGPRRREGTLRAYVGHTAHADPYRNVGRQDLTAHVDLTAVERAGAREGFTPLGTTTQAEFMVGVGVDDLLDAARADARTYEEYLALRSGVARMVDPRAMGAFRVLVLGRGVPPSPQLRGLSFRLRG